ncbi:aminoglycoside-2''-adenylyltransferase [Kribbella voronezhensis]|uniref:Aminoglycoside-2''-adenylyltransferase n=1 Tax=Kribbella voronezhensis TaxID=2512212 RepID=A0A4R7ST65_9ACTN|nr:hypothetical protein [Kribbella voronezhensis]TDU82371.1 aminoglycoside-2''-adenylyltransferase [Kribbella voronezhensis]
MGDEEKRYWYPEGLVAEELEFQRLYGPVEPATREEAAEFFNGLGLPWWIAGGWAIEAFTGVPRHHDDLDVSFWRRHVPDLIRHAEGRYHVWSAGSGFLSPLSVDKPEVPDTADQVWLRQHALAPWKYDVVLNPDRNGRWIFRRDPSLDYDLDEITWVASDGIRYLNPEMALAYKARSNRPKDHQDLLAALPLLSPEKRTWLADMVHHLHPDHVWLEEIRGG